MEKKVIKLEDLKEGMKLRSVKNLYYVSKDNLEEGLMLWDELVDSVCLMIMEGRGGTAQAGWLLHPAGAAAH